MALDTYDNLFKSISNRIERGSSLDTEIDDFIALAEIEMLSNPTESLKISEAETISTANTDVLTRFLQLPAGFKKSRDFSITLPEGIGKLEYRTPNQMNIRNDSGVPCFYTVQGGEVAFDIIPQEVWTVTFDYFKDFTPLTVLNQTNIILDKYPNIYLFGALRQAFIRSQDQQQESIYTSNFLSAIESANLSELEARNGGMAQQTQHWTP
jgi:hypothetical protein